MRRITLLVVCSQAEMRCSSQRRTVYRLALQRIGQSSRRSSRTVPDSPCWSCQWSHAPPGLLAGYCLLESWMVIMLVTSPGNIECAGYEQGESCHRNIIAGPPASYRYGSQVRAVHHSTLLLRGTKPDGVSRLDALDAALILRLFHCPALHLNICSLYS